MQGYFENIDFTEKAQAALSYAVLEAKELGSNVVGTEHLLYGLCLDPIGIAATVLIKNNLTPVKIHEAICRLINKPSGNINVYTGEVSYTIACDRVIRRSKETALNYGHNQVGTEHLLVTIFREVDSIAVRVLIDLGVDPAKLFKDIVNALHNSGLGKDGYSIIGQGKVEEIISAKPENRRAIFEDAAGISKFKQRKVEAERKLQHTQDNLARAQDVIAEQEKQLGPLKRQAENAKKYLEFKEQLKHYEVNTYVYQYDNASDKKQEIQTRIDGLVDALNLKQNEFEKTSAKYDVNMEEVSQIDKKLQDLNDNILSLTVSIEKKTGETNVIKERMRFLLVEKDELTAEIEKEKLNRANAEIQLEATKKHKEEQESKLAELKGKLEDITQKYLEIVDVLQWIGNMFLSNILQG